MNKYELFQYNLPYIRALFGWDAKTLAEHLGVTRQAVVVYEQAWAKPRSIDKLWYSACQYVFDKELFDKTDEFKEEYIRLLTEKADATRKEYRHIRKGV